MCVFFLPLSIPKMVVRVDAMMVCCVNLEQLFAVRAILCDGFYVRAVLFERGVNSVRFTAFFWQLTLFWSFILKNSDFTKKINGKVLTPLFCVGSPF